MNMVVLIDKKEYSLTAEIATTGIVLLHFDVEGEGWGLSAYKAMREDWKEVISQLKAQGIDEIFSIIPRDTKTMKFQEMFGLKQLLDLGEYIIYRRFL